MSDSLLSKAPGGFRGAITVIAYALRALRSRVAVPHVSKYRVDNFPRELTTALRGEHRAGMSALVWYGNLCGRWNVSAAGDADLNAIKVRLPDGWLWWDVALAGVRRTHLERIVEQYGPLLATFACARESDDDADVLASIDEPDEVANPFVYESPQNAVRPDRHHSVWTNHSVLAHGADEKDGNVQRFRCESRFDPLTGRFCDVPFVSGNSIRGLARDLLVTDALHIVGVPAEEIAACGADGRLRIHGMLSGGQLAEGADTAGVDNARRRRWRSLLPCIDLLGGTLDNQMLAGWLRMGELVPAARETAARIAHVLAPGIDPRELAPRLPCVADLFETRQVVRMAHREIDGSDGQQGLARIEGIRAGTTWVHHVALTGQLGVAPPVVRSALARLVELLQDTGYVGAKGAMDLGDVEVRPYSPEIGTSEQYLAHLRAHRDEIRALLLERADSGPAKPGKSKKVGSTKAVEPVAVDDGGAQF